MSCTHTTKLRAWGRGPARCDARVVCRTLIYVVLGATGNQPLQWSWYWYGVASKFNFQNQNSVIMCTQLIMSHLTKMVILYSGIGHLSHSTEGTQQSGSVTLRC